MQGLEKFIYASSGGRTTEEVRAEFGFKDYKDTLKILKSSSYRPLIWVKEDRWYHLDKLASTEDGELLLGEFVWSRAIKKPTRKRAVRKLRDIGRNYQALAERHYSLADKLQEQEE